MADTFKLALDVDIAVQGGEKLDQALDDYYKGVEDAADRVSKLTGKPVKQYYDVIYNVKTGTSEKVLKKEVEFAEQYVKARKKAEATETGSLSNLRQSLNTLKQQRDAVAKYVIDTEKVRTNLFGQVVAVRQQSAQWTDLNNKVQAAEIALRKASGINFGGLELPSFKEFLSLSNKATQIGAAINVAAQAFQVLNQAAQVFIQRQQQIAAITLTLESFGVSAKGTSETLAQAKVIALTYGASLAEVEKGYKRLTPVILASGGSLETTDEVIKSLTARTISLGLNTEQSGRYVEAFAQVLGKGKLTGEELNQQFAELDGALRGQVSAFVASEYGITNLEDAMKSGQITAAIFTEFMIEAGQAARDELANPLGQVQQRLDKLNPQQLQNISNTLNTISIEALGATLGDFGKQLAGIALTFSQFFAAITTNMPGIQMFFKQLAKEVGTILVVAVKSLLVGFQTLLYIIDMNLQMFFKFRDAIRELPVLGPIIKSVGGFWQYASDQLAITVDFLGQVNKATLASRTATTEYKQKVAEVTAKYKAQGKSAEELKKALTELREAEALKVRTQEAEGLKNVLVEQKAIIEQKVTAIDAEIQKTQAAFSARKTALEEEVRLIEAPYNARIQALTEEELKINAIKAAIYEKYAVEKGQITALQTASKAAALAVEKDELNKLYLKQQNARLSAEAARKLDAEIKAKQASIAQNELELKIARDMQSVSAREEKNSAAKNKAEADRALAVQTTKAELEKLEQQEKDVIGKLEAQKSQYEAIGTEIDKNIERTDALKNATEGVATEIDNIRQNISKLSALQIKITKTDARALGGPVRAGGMYQVNELGKEAFLSSSGRLSMINKPAYGVWRAPSSGTVLPAHVTEQLVKTQAMYSVSPQSKAPRLVRQATKSSDAVQYAQLARSQSSMAVELGKLTQAVSKINSKEWVVDLNIAPGNPLLNRLKRN